MKPTSPGPKLAGHSGCSIEYKNDRVRKITSEKNYFSRLKRQAEKQTRFIELNVDLDSIDIPRVLLMEENSQYFWFEMPLIPGFSGLEFLRHATRDDLDWISQTLITFIDRNLTNSKTEFISTKQILDKLEQIAQSCPSKIVSKVKAYCLKFGDSIEIPLGPCHGDLTFSNMIIDLVRKKMWLVDFLDSFIETPLWDVAKVRQDTVYHWIYSCTKEQFDFTKSSIAFQFIDNRIVEHFSKCEWYQRYYPLFQALNLVRLLPYIKDIGRMYQIERHIEDILNVI